KRRLRHFLAQLMQSRRHFEIRQVVELAIDYSTEYQKSTPRAGNRFNRRVMFGRVAVVNGIADAHQRVDADDKDATRRNFRFFDKCRSARQQYSISLKLDES